MKNYPDNFKNDCDPNEIEDVYNGPDPDTEGVYEGPDPNEMNLVYGGPDPGLTECVYAGPEYFRNGNVFEPEPDKKLSSTVVRGADHVKEAARKK